MVALLLLSPPSPAIFTSVVVESSVAKDRRSSSHKQRIDKQDTQVALKWHIGATSPASEALDEEVSAAFLQDCARMRNLSEGKRIHGLLIASGQDEDTSLGNLLIDMYGKCRSVKEARGVFDKLAQPNLLSWNIMLAAYAQNGHCEEAVRLFMRMHQHGVEPDTYTFSTILSAYTRLMDLAEGKKVHERIFHLGFQSDVFVATGLVNFYGKCGRLEDARAVFDTVSEPNVGCWTAMIAAYNEHGNPWDAIKLYGRMKLEGVKPNKLTYVTVLNACAATGASRQGKEIHDCAESEGCDSDVIVGTALVNMYGKCKILEDGRRAFNKLHRKDIVTWNALIAAYAQNGEGNQAFQLFQRMQLEGVKPDKFTFSTIVVSLSTLAEVEYINARIAERGLEHDCFLANTLVTMYGKHGRLEGAKRVFDRMLRRDVISWTAIIGAYVQNGHSLEALELFYRMNLDGLKPNEVTFVSALDACLNLGSLVQGKSIHAAIVASRIELDYFVETALVNMYGKCGSLENARRVFEKMAVTDIVTWTSLIGSYAQSGNGKEALNLFQMMELQGLIPNAVTFVIILSACSHAGLVDEAFEYFASMTLDYSIVPDGEHCLCVIDLLARAGRLAEAEDFIEKMPFKPDPVAWTTLLGACRINGDVQRGARAADDLIKSNDSGRSAPYAMLAGVYSQAKSICYDQSFSTFGSLKGCKG